jgi:multiple sugar transport system substrate-binding protein
MKAKFVVPLVTGLVAISLILSCGSPAATVAPTALPTEAPAAPTPAATEAVSAPTEAPPATAEEVVITVATAGEQKEADMLNTVMEGLKEKQPNIKVEVQVVNYEEFYPKMLTQIAAGTAPDIFSVGDDVADTFLSKGAFLDLNSYISDPEIGIDVTKYYPNIYDIGVRDGKPYLLTVDHTDLATHINTTMFDAAGIPYPQEGWTYDDLVNICQELTLDANGNNAKSPDFDPENIVQWGADQASPYITWYRFLTPFIFDFGGTAISPDGKKASGYLDSEQTAAGLEYYRDLIHKYHCVPSSTVANAQGGVDFFAAGKSAIKLNYGPWQLAVYQSNPDLKFTIVPLPTGPAGHKGATCWAGYGVFSGTKHPREAYLVLREIGTEPGLRVHSERGLASMPSVDEEMGKATDPYWSQFIKELPYAQAPEEFRNGRFMECIAQPLTAQVLDKMVAEDGGDFDLRPALAAVAKEADACLVQQ